MGVIEGLGAGRERFSQLGCRKMNLLGDVAGRQKDRGKTTSWKTIVSVQRELTDTPVTTTQAAFP